MLSDGIHPNANGAEKLAGIVYEALTSSEKGTKAKESQAKAKKSKKVSKKRS